MNATNLAEKIDRHILKAADKVQETSTLDALRACHDLQTKLHEHDKFKQDAANSQIQDIVEGVLMSENVNFGPDLLKRIFLLKFNQQTAIKVIQCYYARHPDAVIEKEAALIPFRDSLFNADLHSALKLADITTGHPNYIASKGKALRLGVYRFAATAVGITFFSKVGIQQIIDLGILLPAWKHMASINAMLLTYLFNSSFFVAIVKFGRQLSAAGGDYLTWQKGTFYTHWYKHADEMAMCTKIVETDVALNGGIDSSASLIEELCRKDDKFDEGATLKSGYTRDGHKVRLLEPKDNLEDLKLQAYWMSGGDGFEWVEPDQDPAELIWKQHLLKLHNPSLSESERKGLKWAENLAEES